jgi:hypothetical protein
MVLEKSLAGARMLVELCSAPSAEETVSKNVRCVFLKEVSERLIQGQITLPDV